MSERSEAVPSVKRLFAFLAHDDQGEGLVAYPMGDMAFPLVGADMARVDSLRVLAQAIANVRNTDVRLVVFEARREIEVIHPAPGRAGSQHDA
jgi:hypothetical protein